MDWHGYPQHPDAHPERPWWRLHKSTPWVRSDDWTVARRSDPESVLPGAVSRSWTPAGEPGPSAPTEELLALIDRMHPLPVPEPRCGQVWVLVAGDVHDEALVVQVIRHSGLPYEVVFGDGETQRLRRQDGEVNPKAWPPLGVLVAGPGAPWAPVEGA
jgi:hypothetical protein